MALLFWIYFARLGYGPSSSQDRIGLLQETTALPFVGMLACIAIFPSEMNLYRHEFMSSARYGVTTFLSVYTIQETITSAISSFLCTYRILQPSRAANLSEQRHTQSRSSSPSA